LRDALWYAAIEDARGFAGVDFEVVCFGVDMSGMAVLPVAYAPGEAVVLRYVIEAERRQG
jgi:hypothetical protein